MPESRPAPTSLSRRELLAGAAALAVPSGTPGTPGTPGTLGTPLGTPLGTLGTQGTPGTVLFANTTVVVTVDDVRHDVSLAVEGDRIAAIGTAAELQQRYPQAQVYDGRGKALIPGLINCHAHLAQTLSRGFNEDYGFPNSYQLAVSPTSLLSREEATLMAVVGAIEALKTGSTTVVENVGGTMNTAAALAATGLRWVFAESATDRVGGSPMSPEQLAKSGPPEFSQKMREEGLQRITALHSAWHGKENGRVSVFPAAGLAENSSPELLTAVRAFADKHDLGYTIHLSQSRAEVEYVRKHHGMSPVGFLAKHNFLGPRLFAAHCRYVDAADIALLAKSGTIVTHQAAMAGNRGVIPPIPALRAAGVPIAMGTDNNTTDLFEVMRVALITERVRRDDEFPGVRPQPEDVLEDATLGSARAVRQQRMLGTLEIGKKADILVLDTQRIHLVPAVRIISAWIHNGQPNDIESVMVDGRFVMRDRKVLTVDEPRLIADADRIGKRVWAAVQKQTPIVVPGRRRK